ncbi:MAG: FAD-dependent monooxygenase [Ignavibacteria bacterium]|nr:FAD-dependent monooxygenase [Ignavibacteria bacterium]
MKEQDVIIVGAGLVGSLLGTMLSKRGYSVRLFERRPDMREETISAGKSINLAMSDRGLKALEIAGLADEILRIAIPMQGRMIHDAQYNLSFQPYGVGNQAINSVSRGELNKRLLSMAEHHGVSIEFNQRCVDVDVLNGSVTFVNEQSGASQSVASRLIFGADGAFSAVRARMQITDRFEYSQTYLPHSYKELHIPPAAGSDHGQQFRLEKNALHIWPRRSYMMIALPNIDGSFTCTLFLAHQGSPSFDELKTEKNVSAFFQQNFSDAVPMMPTLIQDFAANPESSLVTVKCSPWVLNGKVALIGDAAHAIVPFYGQGMNCGFEDCRVLLECLEAANDDWPMALRYYEAYRKPDADAIADLAVENFIEMRDKVADQRFLRRKKIEAFLHERYPDRFIPQYTLVTFSPNVPYCEARRIGIEQENLMEEFLSDPAIYEDWTKPDALAHIDAVMQNRQPVMYKPLSPSSG